MPSFDPDDFDNAERVADYLKLPDVIGVAKWIAELRCTAQEPASDNAIAGAALIDALLGKIHREAPMETQAELVGCPF